MEPSDGIVIARSVATKQSREREAPCVPLNRVAIARRKTGVFRRPMVRNDDRGLTECVCSRAGTVVARIKSIGLQKRAKRRGESKIAESTEAVPGSLRRS